MRTWRYIRRVDDDDDEITVFCVQLICLMIPLLFPSLTHSCGGVLFLHLFFSFCLLAGLGRLGIFFKKNVLLFGEHLRPGLLSHCCLLPTAFYIRTLILLMQWWELKPLCDVCCWLGSGAFLFSFSKKNCCTDGLDLVSFLYDGLISFPFFPFLLVIYILFIWDLRMSTLPAITRTVATRFHYPNEISSPAFFFLYLGVFVECRCGCGVYKQNSWGK